MTVWLHITSGRGPEECAWVVFRLFDHLKVSARKEGLDLTVIDSVKGRYPKTFKSVWLAIDGPLEKTFAKCWQGTVQWIGKSTYRTGHKRKNWFVAVFMFEPVESTIFSRQDYKIETMRSSGPGGQHANKSESCVRMTHRPTGLSATAQEERSQHMNRKLAMSRLVALINERDAKQKRDAVQTMWDSHNHLERGNPIKVFHGPLFKER